MTTEAGRCNWSDTCLQNEKKIQRYFDGLIPEAQDTLTYRFDDRLKFFDHKLGFWPVHARDEFVDEKILNIRQVNEW